ncbi:hypothetical protein [Achromobacter sp. DMS1]|uniref:hypothetical protein n=1 Tax=Achromobacter sp. DMS1 TaxID=1688405 RepID=UPI00190FDE3A|nr:hypothetical protein [Achromobacter sp. DMS1]
MARMVRVIRGGVRGRWPGRAVRHRRVVHRLRPGGRGGQRERQGRDDSPVPHGYSTTTALNMPASM